jgi:hypothetical protein
VIQRCGPWRSMEAVEFATLEWVDGFNHRRLPEPEPHRDCRRLRPLRGWSHDEQDLDEIFT